MDCQDRKRAFSKAFQAVSRDFGDAFRQAALGDAASSVASTPISFYTPTIPFSGNKENETPFFEGKDMTPIAPGASQAAYNQHQGLAPLAVPTCRGLPSSRQPLQELSKEQYSGNDDSSQMLPPLAKKSIVGSLPGSSPPGLNFDSSSSPLDMLSAYLDSEPGPVIYEEPDTAIYDQHIPTGPPTPSELNLQDLSLLDIPRHPLPALPSQSVASSHRASVYVVQSSIFDGCFPEVLPNEVVIAFNKGKQVIKVDKYHLCNQSRFFAKMLDGPFLEAHTRCIRLRNDFPYAIVAMLQFIEIGGYVFEANMLAQYPHITLLDLHIHAYLVGAKYEIPTLCEHAIAEYILVAQMILSMGVTPDDNDGRVETHYTTASNMPSTPSPSAPNIANPTPRDPNDCSPTAVMDRFLDSLVLLWKNTPNRHDAMREAVLELIKPELNNLMHLRFFVTMMMELVPFGQDIVESLEEDGFDVTAIPVPGGVRRRWVVRFGGL